MMKFCVLASGSSGNCIYVESKETRVLVDAGISRKAVQERLAQIGVELDAIAGLCITHDHTDHTAAIPVLLKHHQMPLYATYATASSVETNTKKHFEWNLFEPGCAFAIGDLTFEAFTVPHDAGDPVGFVVSDGERRLGIATDMGEVPDMVAHHLKGCHALILEFNHDRDLLLNADRPWMLKQRILGRRGHLSNVQASDLLRNIAGDHLRTLFLAHLSEDCNTPALARGCAAEALRDCGLAADSIQLCHHEGAVLVV
ncbi:MAG: MBL fold metallo-hydrolase [Kiritimatiellia bacterium]|jgi:phosphoribosyl 1,2-cyclic phosphodiesterase